MTAPADSPDPSALLTRPEVEEAAETLVRAFATTNTAEYFAAFSPLASFIFYAEPQRLPDRASYETLWNSWTGEGWHVVECTSSNSEITLLGNSAVFAHDVATTTETNGVQEKTLERETIVFTRDERGQIVAVHEHLSAAPLDLEDLS